MKDACYLVVDAHGVLKMSKRTPRLRSGEYAVKLNITMDDAFFRRAIPVFGVTVDERHLVKPDVAVEFSPAPAAEGDPTS